MDDRKLDVALNLLFPWGLSYIASRALQKGDSWESFAEESGWNLASSGTGTDLRIAGWWLADSVGKGRRLASLGTGLKTLAPVLANWDADWRPTEAVAAGVGCLHMIKRLTVWAGG